MGCCSNEVPEYISLPRYVAFLTIIGGMMETVQEAFELVKIAEHPDIYPEVVKAYVVVVFLFGPIHLCLGLLLWRGAKKMDTKLNGLSLIISTPVYLTVCITAIALYVEINELVTLSDPMKALIGFKIFVMWFFQLDVFWSYKKIVQNT